MPVHDYLLDPAGFDWPALLAGLGRLLSRAVTVWLVNRFGEPFLVSDDGGVHVLDVDVGRVARLADSREQFCTRIDEAGNAADWLLIPLVDALVAAGVTLGPGQCYGFKVPTVLGGEYTAANVGVLPLAERLSQLADLHDQIKGLPDGATVELRVT